MSDARRRAGEVLWFATQADLEAWLSGNHGRSPGVWLAIAKKGASRRTVSYP
jgi:hypothetical protein